MNIDKQSYTTQTNVIKGSTTQHPSVNTHFTLAVVAICLACLMGLFATPLALASLICSLRAQDQLQNGQIADAAKTAYWAGLFGWITVALAALPVVALIFFGGAIIAFLTALWSAL